MSMKQATIYRSLLYLASALMVGFPIGSAWAAPTAAGRMTALQTTAAAAKATKARTFKGPTEDTQHGPVQVSIVVKSKKIVKVQASISPLDDGRSPFLQERAIPVLKQETLTAQSAKIDVVSGATETSEAFIQSLQVAIKLAKHAKALR
jgi:uncharacterized protein with FMN-binding domain